MSCDDPTFNQTLCQNVTNAGNVQLIKFMMTQRIKDPANFKLKVKVQIEGKRDNPKFKQKPSNNLANHCEF